MEMPNTAAAKAAGIPLKLLIDRRTKTIVFGEAGKELVDFLFSLLSLPLATIVGLLGTHSVPGSVGQLFDSIDRLDNTFIFTKSAFPEQVKEELLNPTLPSKIRKVGLKKLPWNSTLPARDEMLYACGQCWYASTSRTPYVSTTFEDRCPSCGSGMLMMMISLAKEAAEATTSALLAVTSMLLALQEHLAQPVPAKCAVSSSFRSPVTVAVDQLVQAVTNKEGVVTYTITDDLTIAPLSSISTISLMQKLVPTRVPDLAALEERIVTVGRREEKVKAVRVEPADTSSSSEV
ncbi:hypothetical protein EJ110_NYTH48351 [Nymphaea thermarum]|nr:hypothetical protein EJ110_NYTH48351 [Nymphaea thermarum]